MYEEGDNAEAFYFQTKGVSAFLLNKTNNVFAIVNPQKSICSDTKSNRYFQYFGLEDTIINHTTLLIAQNVGDDLKLNPKGEKIMTRRLFNVKCLHNRECLILQFDDLDRMKRDFQSCTKKFIKT